MPMTMLTDSESSFKIMVKSTTTKKTLRIDIHAARKMFENGNISNVGWMKSAQDAANELTKQKKM